MEPGFVKAQTDNLPKIDVMMLASFFGNNPDFVSAEIRGQKLARSARESYGDNAIGYVQVKREGNLCFVKGKITPEHSVRKTAYRVNVCVNEVDEEINFAKCDDCAASQGGCKHAVAFVTWLHRRSEEPPRTSVTCYWKKSKLSAVGTSLKFVKATALGDGKGPQIPNDDDLSFLEKINHLSAESGANNKELTKYFKEYSNVEKLSLHYQLVCYKRSLANIDDANAEGFINFAKQFMPEDVCIAGSNITKEQADNPLWHELRFGRITASKVYSVAHCKTPEGTLVETILGSYKIKDNPAMKRGRQLEKEVLVKVEREMNVKFQSCGLMLSPEYPVMGASPDGICEDFIIEVKCPASDKSFKTYINQTNEVAAKYKAQLQMQMHFLKKKRALFCVAHPDFEKTKNVSTIFVCYEENYCNENINKCMEFWKQNIFPILLN